MLLVSSIPPAVNAGFGLPGLVVAMVMVGLGGGGFKMIMVPFIADQYTEAHPKLKILQDGERVITDRSLTLQYIYNLYYWVGNVGSLSWFATTYLEKKVSFTAAYAITFVSMVLAMLMLLFGANWYVSIPPEGNVLPTATRIVILASRNKFNMAHAEPEYQLQQRQKKVPWTIDFVRELRLGLRACRVLIAFIVFYVCFDQMQNNLISQARQMETHGVPNDMMPAINQVACIAIGPVVQYGLYPFLQRRRIDFKPIARITVGFAFIALSMLYATTTQIIIYSKPPCFKHPRECAALGSTETPNALNVWVQTPVYVFIAIGEIFAYVTALEYAYDHSPKDMKAIVQAFSLLIAGIGSACAMGLTPIARDPFLVYLYAGLTTAMVMTAVVFWWLFRKYDMHDISKDEEDTPVEFDEAVQELDGTFSHHRGGNVPGVMPRLHATSDATLVEPIPEDVEGAGTVITATGIDRMAGKEHDVPRAHAHPGYPLQAQQRISGATIGSAPHEPWQAHRRVSGGKARHHRSTSDTMYSIVARDDGMQRSRHPRARALSVSDARKSMLLRDFEQRLPETYAHSSAEFGKSLRRYSASSRFVPVSGSN